MSVNAINASALTDLSAINGVSIGSISEINGITADVGGGALPTDISGLELWLPISALSQSDDTNITTWPDQSGNARDATGSNVAGDGPKYRTAGGPTGGASVQLGTGVFFPRYFTLPNFLTGFSAGEVFIVLQTENDPAVTSGANGGPPFGNWGSATTGGVYNFSDNKIYEEFGTNARKSTQDPSTALTSWHVYNVRSSSGSFIWAINGATSGGDFFSTGTNTVGWGTAAQIGHDVNDLRTLFGRIVDVIFYSKILDDTTERKAVIHQYLNDTYGFALPTS